MTPANRKSDGPQNRRESILRTASRLWGLHGYHAISLRRIAEDSAVALALIDHYFGSKHALFAQAVGNLALACADARRELSARQATGGAGSFEQLVAALCRPLDLLIRQGADGRHTLLLWLMHWRDPLPELRLPLERAVMPLTEAIEEALAACFPHASRCATSAGCKLALAGAVAIVVDERARQELADAKLPDDPSILIAQAERFAAAAIRSIA